MDGVYFTQYNMENNWLGGELHEVEILVSEVNGSKSGRSSILDIAEQFSEKTYIHTTRNRDI
jgi:hypothetical protein